MATCNYLKIWRGQKFNCLNHILLYAERQTPFNPDEMAINIKWKLFALATWIWVGTLHQIQPELAPRWKYKCFYALN